MNILEQIENGIACLQKNNVSGPYKIHLTKKQLFKIQTEFKDFLCWEEDARSTRQYTCIAGCRVELVDYDSQELPAVYQDEQ